jgi:hypothetical protein
VELFISVIKLVRWSWDFPEILQSPSVVLLSIIKHLNDLRALSLSLFSGCAWEISQWDNIRWNQSKDNRRSAESLVSQHTLPLLTASMITCIWNYGWSPTN